MIKGTSDILNNTTIVLYSVNLCVSLIYLWSTSFLILSKPVHRNRPHHWCSPPAQYVLTLCTKSFHKQ